MHNNAPIRRPDPSVKGALATDFSMAEIMVDKTNKTGCCTVADLTSAGFTAQQIAHHAEAARVLANRMMTEGA